MGAVDFDTIASGRDAEEAFRNAVEEAEYESGHGGYSGTIAEKDSFTLITQTPVSEEEAWNLVDYDDERVQDKWGPAGAIPLDDGRWLFFGNASS